MNAAHKDLYRNALMLAIAALLVLLLSIGGTLLVRRLRLTRRELTETSAVLDETIEELRPKAEEAPRDGIRLTKREREVAKLLSEGKTTHQIAETLFLGDETVIWYRKRLYAKFNVHTIAEFTAEIVRRGLD